MRKFLLSLLSIVIGLSVYAETITITPTDTSGTSEDFSWSTAKNNGSTNPSYNSSAGDLRIYAKGSITISTDNEDITIEKIVFNLSDQGLKRLAPITATDGEIATQASGDETVTWTGSTSSVTFTVGDKADYSSNNSTSSAGQLCFSTIEITYTLCADGLKNAGLAFPESSYTAELGSEFEAPELVKETTAAVTFSSDNEEVAKVDETTGAVTLIAAGKTVITASAPANDEYRAGTASYTLEVIDPNAGSEKIVFADLGYANGTVLSTVTQGNVTLVFDKGTGSTSPAYYTSNKDARLYAGGTLTISVPEEYVLVKVISTYENTTNDLTPSNGQFTTTEDGTDYTEWTADDMTGNSVVFTESGTKGNRSWTSIEIHFTKAGDPNKEDVTLTFDNPEDIVVEFVQGLTVQGRVATSSVEDLTVKYRSSNEEVASVDSNGLLTINERGTAIITAYVEATEIYNGSQISYNLSVEKIYGRLSVALADASEGDVFTLMFPMIVGYVKDSYCYVTDINKTYGLVYGSTPYQAGDVIPAGMKATYTVYNGLPELQPITLPEATETAEYNIETVDAEDVMDQPLNKIVKVLNVNFSEATPSEKTTFSGVVGETYLTFYNQMTLPSVEEGTYAIELIVSTYTYNSTTVKNPNQLQPIAYIAHPAAPAVSINGEPIDAESTFDLKGKTAIVTLTADEGHHIHHVHNAEIAAQNHVMARVAPIDHSYFTEVETNSVDIEVSKTGSLIFHAYNPETGLESQDVYLNFDDSTAIVEIATDEGNIEWFNVAGQRVMNPTKGIYIMKKGSTVSKYVF